MPLSRTIVIAGAGIGGLTAALALVARGFRAIVLERSETLDEAGAGLQLSPNATRVLIDLGLESALAPHVINPDALSVMTARSGREIVRIPLGQSATLRYGAPYWIVRRADLQAALAARARAHPDIDIRLGTQFEDVATYAKGVTVVQRKGNERHQETALALIGADGIWSSVRKHVADDNRPRFAGRIAWRGTIDANQLPREFNASRVQLWMGPKVHLVTYPMGKDRTINLVAIVEGEWNRTGWSEPGEAADITTFFSTSQWPSAARMLVNNIPEWRKWALFALPEGGEWVNKTVALIGDAAHAMLPFVAQGAGMAIEDAAMLAKCLQDGPDNVTQALQKYDGLRRARVEAMQRLARRTGDIYRMSGLVAFARDQAMRALGGQRLLARQDWIYNWRAI